MSNNETTNTNSGGVVDSAKSNAGGSGGGEEDMFNAARKAVDEIYAVHEHPALNQRQKNERMTELITSALQLLDSIPKKCPKENLDSRMHHATYEYLRGKVLNCFPSYQKEAEDHLAKAVELNPSLGDAWLCLGECIEMKGELMAARNCMVLALSKGPNKRILRHLSTLERKMVKGQDSVDAIRYDVPTYWKVALIEEGLKHAKEAVAMDVTDGHSWYCLGNALVRSFFSAGSWDLTELQESLEAYQKAETDPKMKQCPSLAFSGAVVHRYLENYDRALSGYEAAASNDSDMNGNLEIQKMIEIFDIIGILLRAHIQYRELAIMRSSHGAVKVKSTLLPSLDAVKLDPPYKRATLDILQEGVNKAFAIVGKVLLLINNDHRMALYYVLCDTNYRCYILTVYGIQPEAIKEGDQVTILNPCYRHQDFAWKEKRYVFESLRVHLPLEEMRVNGKALSPELSSRKSI